MWYAVILHNLSTGKETVATYNLEHNMIYLEQVRDMYISSRLKDLCYIRALSKEECTYYALNK